MSRPARLPRSTRWSRTALPLLSLTLLAGVINGVAAADCPGPGLSVDPAVATPGSTVQVLGEGLYDGICYDVGGCLQRQPNKARPAKGLTLILISGDRTYRLGGFDPGDDWRRADTVRLPRSAQPGTATLQVLRKDGSVLTSTELVLEPPG